MLLQNPLQSRCDRRILEEVQFLRYDVELRGRIAEKGGICPQELHILQPGFKRWFLLSGYMLPFAIICADCEQDALDEYIDELLPGETPDDEQDAELGYFADGGKWVSECTMAFILFLLPSRFDITIDVIGKPE